MGSCLWSPQWWVFGSDEGPGSSHFDLLLQIGAGAERRAPNAEGKKRIFFRFRELVDLLGLQLSNRRGLFVKLPRAAMANELVDKAAAPFPTWEGCPGKPTDEHYKPGSAHRKRAGPADMYV